MNLSISGAQLIKLFEGVRYKPYRCPSKIWTVGVGSVLYTEQLKMKLSERHTFCLKPLDFRRFTEEEVDGLFRRDIKRFERGVGRLITYPLKQNQFDALVSFAFNVGLGALQRSTLRRKVNRGDLEEAALEFPKWRKAGGRILQGLVRRRAAEAIMFNL